MNYVSTRGGTPPQSFSEVLLGGLAPDGGLYVPESFPRLTRRQLGQMRGWSYQKIALHVLALYVGDDIEFADLEVIINEAYRPRLFGSSDITPIHPLGGRVGILELSNGPTLAFKDIPLQLLARLMDHVLEERGESLTLLGATSGDTGSAAEWAVRGLERLKIFMLSPRGRMSDFQAGQMYKLDEPNIWNVAVDGVFDACQTAVKLVFAEADFKQQYRLGAVNSINWARILAQVVYYVYAWTRSTEEHEHLTVAVPSGNFGNAYAGYVAARMGVPLAIVVGTNTNDVLHQYFATGVYARRSSNEVLKTLSPSMDIATASNFERLVFEIVGRDPTKLTALWRELAMQGRFTLPYDASEGGVRFSSSVVSDEEALRAMALCYHDYGRVIDPHTATAFHAGFDHWGGNGLGPLLILETAKPMKFPDAVFEATRQVLRPSPEYAEFFRRKDKIVLIESGDPAEIAEAVKSIIQQHA